MFYRPHDRVQVDFTDAPKMTKQSMMKECDINNIMRKHEKTGIADHLNQHHGEYADLSDFGDYHTSMNTVANAQQMFDDLPSGIRKKFQNNPSAFLDFAQDPQNNAEMVKMGLAEAPIVPSGANAPTEPTPEPTPSETPSE